MAEDRNQPKRESRGSLTPPSQQGGLIPPSTTPSGRLSPLTPARVDAEPSGTYKRAKDVEFRAGNLGSALSGAKKLVGGMRDVFEREGQEIGRVVQNVPASSVKFFGGLAIDATWGLGRSILHGGGKSPFSIGSEYVPKTAEEAGKSLVNTLKVWERVPFYWNEMQAGRPISAYLIEDIGNLSIIGRGFRAPIKGVAASAASKAESASAAAAAGSGESAAQAAARAARMSSIASAAKKTAGATDRIIYYSDVVGTYPFKPYVWAGKGLGKAYRGGVYVEGIGGWGKRAATVQIDQINQLRRDEPNINPRDPRLTELQKKAARNLRISLSHNTRHQIRQAVRNANHEENAVKGALLDAQRNPLYKDEINPATGEVWGELSDIENQAIISVLNGRAALVKALSEKMGIEPERLAELGKYDETPEYWLTPQGARLAVDFVEGRLTPEHYERLSTALEKIATQVIMATQKAVTGYGRRNLLSPDYLVPLPFINKLRQAVMATENPKLIEVWTALEEAGLLIPLKEAMEAGFTEEQLKLREEALVTFVQQLPDELALDPAMYPANMRENVEFYRRVRRSFNQRAAAAAEKRPLPEPDGSPRAPKEPWSPFSPEDLEALGGEPITGPEQFDMPRRAGKIDGPEGTLKKIRSKIEDIAAKVIKITDKIADLEVKHAKLVQRITKYDIIDDFAAGMSYKAIARKYKISAYDAQVIVERSPYGRKLTEIQNTQKIIEGLREQIGVKRASLPPEAMDAELARLIEAERVALEEAGTAQESLRAAQAVNNIARMADESAIDRLTEEIDIAEDALFDREAEYEDAGGDFNDLRQELDPRDPEAAPVVPEMAQAELNQLTEFIGNILLKQGSDPLPQAVSRTMDTINQAWNQAIDFYENASTEATTAVAELRMQQLAEVITDLTERVTEISTTELVGITLEDAVMRELVDFIDVPANQAIIAGAAPLTQRTAARGSKPVTQSLVPEGTTPYEYGTAYNVYDMRNQPLPVFDPSNIVGSLKALLDKVAENDTNPYGEFYLKYGPATIKRLRSNRYSVEIVVGSADSNINLRNLEVIISFSGDSVISYGEISRALDGMLDGVQERYYTSRSINGVEIEVNALLESVIDPASVIQQAKGYVEEMFGSGVADSGAPAGPRLRAVDQMIDEGAPLADPDMEAIAQQMADDPTILEDIEADVENYRAARNELERSQNPTPEDVALYREERIRKAKEDVVNASGLLADLGGYWDKANNTVTFYLNVRRGTPQWEWWEALLPGTRQRIARKYFRSSKGYSAAAKGPRVYRVAQNIDQISSELGMTEGEWTDSFLKAVEFHEQAKAELNYVKSKDFDVEAAIREDPANAEPANAMYDLEESGFDPRSVEVYDRARQILAERELADIPDNPADVRPNQELIDPIVRAAAYEADVLKAISKEATAKMLKAQRATERLAAYDDYLKAYTKYEEARAALPKLQEPGKRARLALDANEARQRRLREQRRKLKSESAQGKAMENRLIYSDGFELGTSMSGAVPLEVALEGGYPAEQFSVDVPLVDGEGTTRLEPMALQGPMYLPTGRRRQYTGGLRTEVIEEGLPGFNRLSSEHYRDGDRQTIFSIRLLADRLGTEARKMSENEAYRAVVSQFGMTALDLLGDEASLDIYQKAYEKVANMSENSRLAFAREIVDEEGYRPIDDVSIVVDGTGAFASGVPDPKQVFNLALREQYGRMIAEEMQARGFQAVDPYKTIEAAVALDRITHETMFLPDGIRSYIALRKAIIDPNSFGAFWRGANKVTGYFKTTTLALSVMWQLGDLVSNVIVAQMTGVNVKDMISQIRRIKREEYGPGFRAMWDPRAEMPTPTSRVRIAQESPIQDIGLSVSERNYLMGVPEQTQPSLLTRLSGIEYPQALQGRSPVKIAFRINETINRLSRHAYFLELLERRLAEVGKTLDEVAADGSWRTDPEIKALVFEVADTANDWLGDFADLSMAERKYMIANIPFYSWIKHIHKVFLMMGDQHPQSLRWYVYMGTLSYDPDEDPMNLRYGNPSIFGGAVSLNPFNPFADVFGGPVAEFLQTGDIQPTLSQLGPVPRLIGGAIGIDVSRGRAIQRPPGEGAYTESGLSRTESVLRDPTEALGFGLMQFPIFSRALNVLPGERLPGTQIALGPVTRYQTGEARLKPGTERPIERWGGRPAALARMFSLPLIPYQSDEQIEEVTKSARSRLRSIEKLQERRRRYLRSLDK